MRYEHKYVIDHFHALEVQQLIRMHPAGFQKVYPDRLVNNLYFDTADFATFQHNLMGVSQREKYRIRWYGVGEEAISNVRLETKIKDNLLGRKIWTSAEVNGWDGLLSMIPTLDWTRKLQLQPVLLNAYQRSYFGTFDQKFRITIDHQLQFGPFQVTQKKLMPPLAGKVILELKYDQQLASESDRITQYLPFRVDKHSKYVTGTSLIYH